MAGKAWLHPLGERGGRRGKRREQTNRQRDDSSSHPANVLGHAQTSRFPSPHAKRGGEGSGWGAFFASPAREWHASPPPGFARFRGRRHLPGASLARGGGERSKQKIGGGGRGPRSFCAEAVSYCGPPRCS